MGATGQVKLGQAGSGHGRIVAHNYGSHTGRFRSGQVIGVQCLITQDLMLGVAGQVRSGHGSSVS